MCVKRGNHPIATYVGSYDDCDRWLENNRGFAPEPQLSSAVPRPSEGEKSDHPSKWKARGSEPDYDDILMEQIDEKILLPFYCFFGRVLKFEKTPSLI